MRSGINVSIVQMVDAASPYRLLYVLKVLQDELSRFLQFGRPSASISSKCGKIV